MRHITRAELAVLTATAQSVPRGRQNLNLHPDPDDPVQRLLNALEPGTYVRPHRHSLPPKWELLTIVTGRAAVLVFDADGAVQERIELDSATPIVELPPATWHSLVALESGTVLLEVKPGPYVPTAPAEFAAWAPAEGSAAAPDFERWCRRARVGERAPPGRPAGL
jgi:cupin fold WbuC family metalloprotein